MSSQRTPFEKFYEFHKLLIRCGKIGWTMEDSFYTLLNELDKAGLLKCGRFDDPLDNVLRRSYIKMATAVYSPCKLKTWADEQLEHDHALLQEILSNDN